VSRSSLFLSLPFFIVIATANGAGYRYGVSDQAFYIPAIVHAADPATFPRDRELIEAQARLMVLDEAIAALMRVTGLPLPAICAAAYVVSLALVWAALASIGRSLYVHSWTTVALLAAYTLRHQITRTSANSLEPYFHPRVLAFGVCALAVPAVLQRKSWTAIALVAAGGLIHPTTAIWFAVMIGVAVIVADRRLRPMLLGAAALAAATAAWAIAAGPLAGSLVIMDDEWLQVLATKTTLFATQWPAAAWIANLGTAAVWAWAYVTRRSRGVGTAEDDGLAAGGAALLLLFLATLPFVAARVFVFVELQIPRVFWLIDLMATVYALAALDRLELAPRLRRAGATVLILLSATRGTYALWIEHPERRLFSPGLERSAWHDAMRWIEAQPVGVHVLADPGHAWKYGTSVRVSARRDVFQEDVKDSAIAIYSRGVAMRVLERSRALGDFDRLTAERARELARRYDVDYLVTTAALPLPLAYRNAEFAVYALGRKVIGSAPDEHHPANGLQSRHP
jgi:hypothetical protein